ncbi:MAG: hypothetical protein ACOH1Y_17980 [Propionicimonas sp.]
MDMRYLGIGLVLVIGIAVVVYGWLGDRMDTKRRQAALDQPPDRPIPGLSPEASAPSYVTGTAPLQPRTRTVLSPEARTNLQQRLNRSPSLAYGHAAAEFTTDADSGLCVLAQPWILVANEPVDSIRELLPFLRKASAAGHKVVLVAPAIDDVVLGTLRVNAASGTLDNACVLLPNLDQRRALCSLVGGDPLSRQDLRAGYVPPSAIGTCGTWVSSSERLWILAD